MMEGKEASTLQAFVEAIDRSDRLILLLHFADDLSPGEIAVLLEKPLALIEERLQVLRRRARSALGAPRMAVA